MTLVEFLAALRKRWAYVVVPFVLLCLATGISSKLETPVYTAKASAYFSMPVGQSASDLYQGSNYTQQQLGSFAALATKPIVLNSVIDDLGLDVTPDQLSRSVMARAAADSSIIEVSATSTRPERAAQLANTVTENLGQVVQRLSPSIEADEPSVVATTVARAEIPKFQSSPNAKRNVMIGGVAGLIIGILLALAREKLDTRLRGQEDLPDAVAVLGRIPFDRKLLGRHGRESYNAVSDEPGGEFASRGEAVRKLRTNLRFLDVDHPVKVITVTSSVSSEGKSRTTLDLAKALADDGQRVLLMEADLRRPRIADYLSIEGAVGLVDVLAGNITLGVAVQRLQSGRLHILPSGTIPPNPSELLGSRAMVELIDDLRERYDVVLIDAPPLLPVTDGLIVGAKSDGVLIVVRHGRTTRHQLSQSLTSLEAVEARVLGVVFSMVPQPKPWQRQDDYAYYRKRQTFRPGMKVVGKSGEVLR